jgi:hypothetical protein
MLVYENRTNKNHGIGSPNSTGTAGRMAERQMVDGTCMRAGGSGSASRQTHAAATNLGNPTRGWWWKASYD